MSCRPELRAVGLAVLLLAATVAPAWGHGQADQSYPPTADTFGASCGEVGASLFQSFTPTASTLVAVGVYLNQPANVPTTLRIRGGGPAGVVLATVTASFPAGAPQPLHFDLPSPLAVIPGAIYVIEVVFPHLFSSWLITSPGGSYPGGQSFGCEANPNPTSDFHFVTYVVVSGCTPNVTTLCLHDARFRVTADWRTGDGTSGAGRAVQLTDDAGYFWFFDAANVEVLVKMVDACSFNQRFWVFSAGLTDVRVDLTVLDTEPEAGKTYVNPLGRPYAPILDTNAFATCP
jgi:hypothetical protein